MWQPSIFGVPLGLRRPGTARKGGGTLFADMRGAASRASSLPKVVLVVVDSPTLDVRGFCYPHPGASKDFPPLPANAANHGYAIDHKRVKLGSGNAVYERAKTVLNKWGHFQLGWAEVDPSTPVEKGSGVCVKSKVLFLWTRHPLSIVYVDEQKKGKQKVAAPGGEACKARYTFAHGCLHGHMLAGEERFAVEWLEEDDSVWYDVAAFSKPAGPLSTLSYPFVRLFQARFGADSIKAMQAGVANEK